LTNIAGCDSLATLYLTINYSNSGSASLTRCDHYTWPSSGLDYTVSGTYHATLTNVAGCDSLATLYLTINYSNSGSASLTICDHYTWPSSGLDYTLSRRYPISLTNVAGCDSLATLYLTINYSNSGSASLTRCDHYTWPSSGLDYTISGTYHVTLTNVA